MDVEHIVIAKMFEEEVNSFLKGREERQPAKKRTILFGGSSICANFNPHLYIYFIVLCEHFSNKIKME